jgi:hypothetical protein
MTLTIAEIIEEVRREAERKHGVPDEMAQNWPRFSVVKVMPLCDAIDRLTAERDALAAELAQVRAQLATKPTKQESSSEWGERMNREREAYYAERDRERAAYYGKTPRP